MEMSEARTCPEPRLHISVYVATPQEGTHRPQRAEPGKSLERKICEVLPSAHEQPWSQEGQSLSGMALHTDHLRIEWIHQTLQDIPPETLLWAQALPCWHRVQREKEEKVVTRSCRCSGRWESDFSFFHIQRHLWSHVPFLPPSPLPPVLPSFLPSTNACWEPTPKWVGHCRTCLTKKNVFLPNIPDLQPWGEKGRHVGKL